ncbi:valine--tRNA ligase [Biomphalaria glabrata]
MHVLMTSPCQGMKRFDARKAVLEALKELGLYRGTKDNPMVVPTCSRSKDVIEPLLKPQWYVDVKDMSARAVKAVQEGELRIIPDMFKKTWYSWLENTRDWCISRQLWWGHRIPAYFVTVEGQTPGQDIDGHYWVSGRTEVEAKEAAAKKFGVDVGKISLRQDEDVLDTWFSSGFFPMSVFGWPENTEDYQLYFPNTLLETGHDILFFWVARMVQLALTLTDKLPFKDVYLHAMVRDAHGRKMSKSLGNIVDPVDVILGITLEDLNQKLNEYNLDEKEIKKAIEGQKVDYPNGIPECGVDALRFALISYTAQGRDMNLDVMRVQGYRFFCNKLWNATKFALGSLGENFQPYAEFHLTGKESLMDLWILSRLSQAIKLCNEGMENFEFPTMTTAIYNFWLYELCDWYLECIKPVINGSNTEAITLCRNVLYTCLDAGLRLLHPAMPFLTEELFQRLPRRKPDAPPSICITPYPETCQAIPHNPALEYHVEFVQNIVKSIRSVRSEYQLPPKAKVEVYLKCSEIEVVQMLKSFENVISTMGNSSQITFMVNEEEPPAGCAVMAVSSKCETHIMLKGQIDIPKEKDKMETKKDNLMKSLAKLEDATKMPDYLSKVPEDVRFKNEEKMSELKGQLETVTNSIQTLLKLM